MKKIIALFLLTSILCACAQEYHHPEPTHNFTVNRFIILNDNNEMLMGKEEGHWYNIGEVYDKPQFVMESLNSIAEKYGITTTPPKLHAYLSYKYEYHPYSSLRAFYVARYVSGDIIPGGDAEEMKWMPIDEAIAKIPVESIKMTTQQIIDYPNTLWGGSFVVFRKGEEHHARIVEDFYPLFE